MHKLVITERKEGFASQTVYVNEKWLEKHTIAKNAENWAKDNYRLVFIKTALSELHRFIGWQNINYPKNRVEQIGFWLENTFLIRLLNVITAL